MKQSVKVLLAQVKPRKGDYVENVRRVGSVLAQAGAMDLPPDLVVFPETFMSGYFVQGGVADVAVTAGSLFRDLAEQHVQSAAPPLDLVVGFYERFRGRVFNSALYASLGGPAPGVRHVHRKVFLPTYGIFDEKRFVEHGTSVRAFDTAWGRVAVVVCEDAWHSIVPMLAALDGAQVIIVPSAAPARGLALTDAPATGRPGSARRWKSLLANVASEHGVYMALAQLVGFEGGKGFQGCSMVVGPSGKVLTEGPPFDEAFVTCELTPAEVVRARADQRLLGDLEMQLTNLLKGATEPRLGMPEFDAEDECPRSPPPAPVGHVQVLGVSDGGDPLAIDPTLAEKWLTAFLRGELIERRNVKQALVGLSGGVDSAVTAALAVRALGHENVIGVRMPYRTSSQDSMRHAEQFAESIQIELRTIDISDAVDGFVRGRGGAVSPRRLGNVMARVRMITLFDLSAELGALPLGTGNKTERLLGYFTWHGDDAPPVNPLGDLYKTQVWQLARHLGVPGVIVDKKPSADLEAGQTDEGDLGVTYERADPILFWTLAGLGTEEIVAKGFPLADVKRVRGWLQATHWKRHLPTVAVVSDTAIGESYLRPVDY